MIKKIAKGFTLIEVIISMMIMTLVISLAVGSYRYFLNFGSHDHVVLLNQRIDELTRIQQINDNVRNTTPFYYSNRANASTLFFIGEEKGLSFVTSTPLLSNDGLAVAMLYLEIENEYDVLRYCEIPLGSIDLNLIEISEYACESSIEYMRAFDIELEYFAYESSASFFGKMTAETGSSQTPIQKPKWFNEYASYRSGVLPIYVRIRSVLADDKYTFMPNELLIRINQENPESQREKTRVEG